MHEKGAADRSVGSPFGVRVVVRLAGGHPITITEQQPVLLVEVREQAAPGTVLRADDHATRPTDQVQTTWIPRLDGKCRNLTAVEGSAVVGVEGIARALPGGCERVFIARLV